MQPKQILNVFNSLKACYDTTERYPVGNPMVVQIFKTFLTNYKTFLDEDDDFRIDFEPTAVRVNGMPVPHSVLMSESVLWLQQSCMDRKIETLIFESGATLKDLQKFIAVLFHPAKRFSDRETASKMLFRQHVQSIAINPENLDATFSDLDRISIPRQAFGQGQTTELDPDIIPTYEFNQEPVVQGATPAAPYSGRAPTGLESFQRTKGSGKSAGSNKPSSSQKVHLFISSEDRDTLLESMNRFIDEGRLKKVAESLTMMRRDMASSEYEVRRLAFSSYHVVVLSLIRRDQLRPLSSILKTLEKDLGACKEPELYRIHFQSLLEILQWMRRQKQFVRMCFALDLLAREQLRQTPEIQTMVKKHLEKTMDLGLIEELMRLEFDEIKPYFKSLFVQHGLAVVNPCLQALFLSEDRSVRKKLLEILMRQGPMIYPMLLKELERTINGDFPWYIKRNLLTIMAKDPPIELLPYLDQLLEERNTRILDLVYRCLFLINDRSAVEKGKALLKKASGSLRTKLFQYVRLSKEPAYARFIAGLYENEPGLKEKIDIINILAQLDSADTIAFFDKILQKTKLFESKEEARLRGEAAKALAASEHAAARTALTKYARDKNEMVRAMVERISRQTEN